MDLGEPVNLYWQGVELYSRARATLCPLGYLDVILSKWFSLSDFQGTLKVRLHGTR
jgi:hypothetical protein